MGKRSRKRKHMPRIGVCTYCGAKGEVTRDHVIPRCLSRKGTPATFVVDACRPCNLDKSETEDDLRDYLALSINSEGHPYQRTLMNAVARSAKWNRSPLARSVKWGRRELTAVIGGVARDLVIAPNDPEPFWRCVQYIVAGLHFRLTQKRVGSISNVELGFIGFPGLDPVGELVHTMGRFPTHRLTDAGDVLEAYVWRYPEHADLTLWRLAFYGHNYFLGFVEPAPEISTSGSSAQ